MMMKQLNYLSYDSHKRFLPDEEQIGLLRRLLPEDESVFFVIKKAT